MAVQTKGSLLMFGRQEVSHNVSSASMEWISSDLAQKESFVFEPHSAFEVGDAIPTGKPGEFVAVRKVIPDDRFFGNHEKREGIVLSFVQVR